ncbi:MAG: aspartate aminotransferase family protein [Micromonosporaceae bacterium]|nr:aspartate aminotransferase family protein [Micromonosporaceae bacterium]
MTQTATHAAGDRYVLVGGMPRDYRREMVVVAAEGSWLTLADGRRLLDLHGQHMCLAIGHRHPALVAALHQAIDGVHYAAADFLTHDARSAAARLLIEQTLEGRDHYGAVRFVCSGSEATEMALMLARLYTQRPVVVSRDLGFHGWTAGAAAATGVAWRRNALIAPGQTQVRQVPGPHTPYPAAPAPLCASCPLGRTYPACRDAQGTLACVNATESVLRSVGVEQVAAFITELWHGAGAFLVPDEYPAQIRALTQRLGVLWIDDEAIGGPARTGSWWAFQNYGVRPDIVTMAKGISNAAVPVGACAVSPDIASFVDGSWWTHSSTFSGHPLAAAAVVATLQVILDEDLVQRAVRLGDAVSARLAALAAAHACVSGFTGRGLLWGLELVRDPRSGARWVPADRRYSPATDGLPRMNPSRYVSAACAERGVLLVPYAPNTVTLAPALTIGEGDLWHGIDVLDECLTELDRRMGD